MASKAQRRRPTSCLRLLCPFGNQYNGRKSYVMQLRAISREWLQLYAAAPIKNRPFE